MGTLLKKSIGDLNKRRSRTIFTILTIALGVAALGMFAVTPMMDSTVQEEIDSSNMYDIRVSFNDIPLTGEDLDGLRSLDNVNEAEPKHVFFTRIYVGERRNNAYVVGVRDFSDQTVDRVSVKSGRIPGNMQVLTDTGNSKYDIFHGGFGDTVTMFDSSGDEIDLEISGEGRNMVFSSDTNWGTAVFFSDLETAHRLSGGRGYNLISFDLEDSSKEAIERTLPEIRSYLENETDLQSFSELPLVREEGSWPGDDEFDNFATFFFVLTFITLFCSVFLISNTMHTIISEQKKEIAQMKAVGATRLQVIRSYLTTSSIMGVAGALIGAFIGIWVSFGMLWFVANNFYNMEPEFGIHPRTVILSMLVGISITIIASIPALIGGLRTPVREGMESAGISARFGRSFIDKFLMRLGFLPRNSQMGLRNVVRKKGRSLSTILQVALAVGMFLGIVSIGYSISEGVAGEFDKFSYEILTSGQMDGGKPLTEDLDEVIYDVEGVSIAEPFVLVQSEIGDESIFVFGYPHDTVTYKTRETTVRGQWFTEEDERDSKRVVVISRSISRLEGKEVGDNIEIGMATGRYIFRVIGINNGQIYNGMSVWAPISTIQDLLFLNDTVTGFSIVTDTGSHKEIDRVSTDVEDTLLSRGYVISSEIKYVQEKQNEQSNQQIINLMIAIGTLIVVITMIGLMSTLTMNVIERTREIGMFRCVGSRSGDIRRVFAVEGVIMALIGVLLGIPFGYGLAKLLNHYLYDLFNLEMPLLYPLSFIGIAALVTLIVTLLIVQPPLWRATHIRPGDALRYQ